MSFQFTYQKYRLRQTSNYYGQKFTKAFLNKAKLTTAIHNSLTNVSICHLKIFNNTYNFMFYSITILMKYCKYLLNIFIC